VGFVVDKVVLGQVFSKYFGFPCQFSFHSLTPHSSSGACTIGQLVADIPSGLSLTLPQETKKPKQKNNNYHDYWLPKQINKQTNLRARTLFLTSNVHLNCNNIRKFIILYIIITFIICHYIPILNHSRPIKFLFLVSYLTTLSLLILFGVSW
jgi:hypothetical protein